MSQHLPNREKIENARSFRHFAAALALLMAGASIVSSAHAAEMDASVATGANVAQAGNADIIGSAKDALPVIDKHAAVVGALSEAPADELMIGDKIQVSFFEQLDLGQGTDAGMTADIRTFYQRLDLTGEHVVEADGSINIALLGRFVIGGMTSDEARLKVTEGYRTLMGKSGEVSIKILDRKPIFVTGIVKSPGSFRFEPGMITAQAIALAGGYDRPAEATSRLFESQRERERRAQATDRLERLLARRVRLVRQRDLLENSDAGKDKETLNEASEFSISMESEMRLLDAEISARSGEVALENAKLSSAREQLSALKTISEIVGKQISVRSDRLRVLQKLQGSGISTLEVLWNAQSEVADLQMQKGRLTAEIVSAENSIVQNEAQALTNKSNRNVAVERELAAVEEEINQQKNAVNASEAMIAALETTASGAQNGEPLKLKIMRRTPAGTTILDADEAMDLRPGDVVKVGAGPGPEDTVSATTSSL